MTAPMDDAPASSTPVHVDLPVKVVPGARRDQIAGPLGGRLKIRVAAPPEGGRANDAVCALVAATLGLRPRQVRVVSGHASPEKVVRITGVDPALVRRLLGP